VLIDAFLAGLSKESDSDFHSLSQLLATFFYSIRDQPKTETGIPVCLPPETSPFAVSSYACAVLSVQHGPASLSWKECEGESIASALMQSIYMTDLS
jgi:hypothetical protein